MKRLTLTIVIPAYDEEGYLAQCLDSIACQAYKPEAVIVVDNNSTDSTAKIAARYKFVTLAKETKQGAVNARNRGFNLAKTDIIARIDADCRLPRDWTKIVARSFSVSGADVITGPARGYDLPLPRLNWLPHHLLCRMLTLMPPGHPYLFGFNMAIRRPAWRKVRRDVCLDNLMHEDLDLAIHLHGKGFKISYLPKIILSASGRRYNDHWKQFHFYMKTYARTYRRHGINNWLIYLAITAYYLGYFFYRPWTFLRQPRRNPMGI